MSDCRILARLPPMGLRCSPCIWIRPTWNWKKTKAKSWYRISQHKEYVIANAKAQLDKKHQANISEKFSTTFEFTIIITFSLLKNGGQYIKLIKEIYLSINKLLDLKNTWHLLQLKITGLIPSVTFAVDVN